MVLLMSTVTCLNHADSTGIATIILNRPDCHNALNEEMVHSLLEHLQALEENRSVRAVILEGSGDTFCAGVDLNWMKCCGHERIMDNDAVGHQLAELLSAVHHFNKPTIAIVKGAAFGGGIGLIACCDIALATRTANFCFSEVRLGLIPSVISPYVIGAIGARTILRYFLTAERFDAVEAHRIGLIHEVLTEQSLGTYTQKITQALIAGGPGALTRTKKLVDEVSNSPLGSALIDTTLEWISDVRQTAEAQEGVSAFMEKRQASWRVPG